MITNELQDQILYLSTIEEINKVRGYLDNLEKMILKDQNEKMKNLIKFNDFLNENNK